MKMPRKKFWAVPLCALCAAALIIPAWAADAAKGAVAPEAARTVVSASGMENEDLFYGYLLQRAGASDRVSLMADAGSKLNAKDKELYDLLKVWVSKIASGEETNTVYEIVYDDFQKTWTAEELGVSDFSSYEGQEAISAKIDELYDYDTDAVLDALLADCPYELYWYDKSDNGGVGFGYSDVGYRGTRTQVTLTGAPKFTVMMSVARDYGGGTTVNRNLHKGIDKIVTTAQSIVEASASRSDYEKLLAYSTEICNLVKYDNAAAENANAPYGDPWQLISVFDGDPNTNVVCEGYAKAFKYLCDLSAFSSPKVECYLVTGVLTSGTGAGAHMWNIVTMENGKNYLVDVTNSDSNGGPKYLLLKGGSPSPSNLRAHTFYNWITFVYDDEIINLWGEELLTLDTVDYKDAEPVTPSPALQLGGYALSVSGEAVSMAHIRDGATIAVTKDASETESNVTLFLVGYDAQGKMESLQQWNLDCSLSSVSIQTQAVNASRAKFIILSENLTPMASAATLE